MHALASPLGNTAHIVFLSGSHFFAPIRHQEGEDQNGKKERNWEEKPGACDWMAVVQKVLGYLLIQPRLMVTEKSIELG